jgi:thymidylate kinase
MKLILLTGLDGSGKSTLLSKLEKVSVDKPIAYLRVPKIDSELFRHNKMLYNVTLFINHMHIEADHLKKTQLKVIALFSSMLVFKELLKELTHNDIQLVFCERHPLIDTGVYAKFYSGKMNPADLPQNILTDIESKYSNEISCLLNLIGIQKSRDTPIFNLLQYIHNWFSVNQKHELNDLQQLFGVGLPDKIIYLSASPHILMERLNKRAVLEAHESEEVFKKLIPAYEKIFSEANVAIEKIDANSFTNLNQIFEEIKESF